MPSVHAYSHSMRQQKNMSSLSLCLMDQKLLAAKDNDSSTVFMMRANSFLRQAVPSNIEWI